MVNKNNIKNYPILNITLKITLINIKCIIQSIVYISSLF